MYGNPCYVEELEKIANRYNLVLIYDAAHAFNVKYRNVPIFNYGDVSIISFHATKVFHTIEGGALIFKNKSLLKKFQLIRNHGIVSEEQVILPGTNAKMNEFEAIMGLCNLDIVNTQIKKRKYIYEYYKQNLSKKKFKFQKIIASKYNYSYMPVLLNNKKNRNKLYTLLIKNGIFPRKYFYPLTSDYDYIKNGTYKAKNLILPVATDISNRILCLPLYGELKKTSIKNIINLCNNL